MPRDLRDAAAQLAPRALRELEALVDISSPSGDVEAAERLIALCTSFLPGAMRFERPGCSTPGCAPDLIASLAGTGHRRLLLLGHLDTVVAHDAHAPARLDGGRLHGSGTADMKGGVALALALARSLAQSPDRFAELSVLMVCDEEWRTEALAHVARFDGYDTCLCFEAGELGAGGEEAVIVRRKGAGTLRVHAHGLAAHSGAAPEQGRNALLALARVALDVAAVGAPSGPSGPDRLSVVPTIVASGDAANVVPARGELVVDFRADDVRGFERVLAAVPGQVDGVRIEPVMERVWPAMDSTAATAPVLSAASALLGRPLAGNARGGASDASHFAPLIDVTIDGLGPRGGGAHTPEEFVAVDSIAPRLEVALAVVEATLGDATP